MTLSISVQGQGLPLVFLHGWGLNSGVWQPLAKRLSSTYQVITVDLPGFGVNQQQIPKDYNLASLADAIAQEIDGPAVWLGWSLGGLVASQIALAHTEKVTGLVTIASTPHFVEQLGWPGIKQAILAGFHHQLSKNPEHTIRNFLKIQAMGSPHLRQDIRALEQLVMQFPQPSAQVLDLSLSILESADLRSQLANITVPFLRIYGRLDSLIPSAVIELVNELAPQSHQITLTKASHAPFISDEQEFYQVLCQWLERQFG